MPFSQLGLLALYGLQVLSLLVPEALVTCCWKMALETEAPLAWLLWGCLPVAWRRSSVRPAGGTGEALSPRASFPVVGSQRPLAAAWGCGIHGPPSSRRATMTLRIPFPLSLPSLSSYPLSFLSFLPLFLSLSIHPSFLSFPPSLLPSSIRHVCTEPWLRSLVWI